MVWYSTEILLVQWASDWNLEYWNLFRDFYHAFDVSIPYTRYVGERRLSAHARFIAYRPLNTGTASLPQSSHNWDVLLQLFAKHEAADALYVSGHNFYLRSPLDPRPQWYPRKGLPVSPRVMLASAARRPFVLDFEHMSLTIEQWRALALHCPSQVRLWIDGDDPNATRPVVEALQADGGQLARLAVRVSRTTPISLETSLAASTSLKELHVDFLSRDGGNSRSQFFRAIQRSHGLVELRLYIHDDLLNDDWFLLWSAVGSHPTLRSLEYFHQGPRREVKPDWADAVLRAARSNPFLFKLTVTQYELPPAQHQDLKAILNVNRKIRHQVQTSRSDIVDPVEQDQLMKALFVSDGVRDNLDQLYFVLRANPYWFADAAATDEEGTYKYNSNPIPRCRMTTTKRKHRPW